MPQINLIELQELTGIQAFNRFLSTLQPKEGSKEIWLKLGSDQFYVGNWDKTGNFDIYKSQKLDGDKTTRIRVGSPLPAWSYLDEQTRLSENGEGVLYIPTQPQLLPIKDCVTSTDTLACEFDAGTFEEQHRRYSEFTQVTGLIFSSLVGSGGKSIHAYLKLIEHLAIEQIDYLRKLFAAGLFSDPVATRLWQPMRIPGFFRANKNKEQILHHYSDAKYTYEQVLAGLKLWFDHIGLPFIDRLPEPYWQGLSSVLAGKNYQSFEDKLKAVKQFLSTSVDDFERNIDQARFTREQYKASFENEGFYDSVFSQAIEKIAAINAAATVDDFAGITLEQFEGSDHLRCCCPFHDSGSGNSAWMSLNHNGSGMWTFHCTACTHDRPVSYSEYWGWLQVDTEGEYLSEIGFPKLPQGENWWAFVKRFLSAHDVPVDFLDNRKDLALIPTVLHDIYGDYFLNYKTQGEALEQILKNLSPANIPDLDTFLPALFLTVYSVYAGKKVSIDSALDQIKRIFSLKSTLFTSLNKEASKIAGRKEAVKKSSIDSDKFQDLSEQMPFYDADYLFYKPALKEVCVNRLIRTEEGASNVYKHYVSATYIFELFIDCFHGRLAKKTNENDDLQFLFYEHIEGTEAYKWRSISITSLHSKIWTFARQLLRFVDIADNDFDSMVIRCNDYFKIELSQKIELIPENFTPKYYEDTNYRPYLNGIFDLTTKKLLQYNPKYFTTYVLPYKHHSKPNSEPFEQLKEYIRASIHSPFSEGDKIQMGDFVMDTIALAVMGQASRLKSFLWLVGKSNLGKTAFVKLIASIIDPSVNVTTESKTQAKYKVKTRFYTESPSNLLTDSNRFKNAIFRTAFMVTMDDKRGLSNDEMNELKTIVSVESTLRDEDKGGETFTIVNKALLIFTGESDPQISFLDKGGVNRLALVDFVSSPKEMYDRLKSKLTSVSFREAIDSYIVNNFDPLAIEKRYETMPACVLKRQNKFREDNDPLTQFLVDCLDFSDANAYEVTTNICKLYGWFDENCVKYKTTDRNIGLRINPELEKRCEFVRTTINKITGRYCLGVQMKPWEEIEEYLHFKDEYTKNQAHQWYIERNHGVNYLKNKVEN